MRSKLLRWHRAHAPVRGWEDERDPYRILVREVMSQQTQISRVVKHHARFCARFPTVRALAAATPADVIRAWRGLGYNRRAIALHRAARTIAVTHGGRVPNDLNALRALPGIGPYTAAAITVYAFGQREPVIDTNVARVAARAVIGRESAPRRDVEGGVRALLHRSRDPRAVTQALMDLGAQVCTARAPRCEACPLASACAIRTAKRPREVSSRSEPSERFEGSARQRRGRILNALRDARARGLSVRALAARTGKVSDLLPGLERDGLIERRRGAVRLPS